MEYAVDIVLLTLLALSTLQGIGQGPLLLIKSLCIWIFTLVFALWLSPATLALLHLNDPSVLLFLAVVLIETFLFYSVFRVVLSAVLSGLGHSNRWTMRIFGGLLGVVKGGILVSYLLFLVSFTHWGQTKVFEESQIAQALQPGLRWGAKKVDFFWQENLLSWPRLLKDHPFIQRAYAPVLRNVLYQD